MVRRRVKRPTHGERVPQTALNCPRPVFWPSRIAVISCLDQPGQIARLIGTGLHTRADREHSSASLILSDVNDSPNTPALIVRNIQRSIGSLG
jgi:hypothetical protein